MTQIDSMTDLTTWILNNNPGNALGAIPVNQIRDAAAQIAEAIRSEDDRPAWRSDWSAWLDENAERVALAVAL